MDGDGGWWCEFLHICKQEIVWLEKLKVLGMEPLVLVVVSKKVRIL